MVSDTPGSPPGFANTAAPVFAVAGPVKPLPPNTEPSFWSVSCGSDGAGMMPCMNSSNQSGFVISPAGSYIVGETPARLEPRTVDLAAGYLGG